MPYKTVEELKASLARYQRRIRNVIPNIVAGSSVPIPEFVDRKPGREWVVKRSAGLEGFSNPTDCEMTVPFGSNKMARSTRIEELMHARHSTSPKSDTIIARTYATKARRAFIQGAEDLRIKTIAVRGEFNADQAWRQGEYQFSKMTIRSILMTPPDQGKLVMGGCPYPFEAMAHIALSTRMARNAKPYWVQSVCYDYAKAHELAPAVASIFINFGCELDDAISKTVMARKYRYKIDGHTPGKYNPFTLALAIEVEKVVQKYEAKTKYMSPVSVKEEPSKNKEVKEVPPNHPWAGETPEEARFREASGKMVVHKPPLHRRLLFNIKEKTSSAIGPILHRIENIVIDAIVPPIFGIRDRKSRKPPVVLLDASGSMGINAPDVEHLIKMVPGAIVYFYNGNEVDAGQIVLVSHGGRFCERKAFEKWAEEGGNTVDYMALKYCLVHHVGHELHWVTDKCYTWPKPYRGRINADLTNYALDRKVKYHYNLVEFKRAIDKGEFNKRGY